MEGRPATMMRSPRCRPVVRVSSRLKPVVTPESMPLFLKRFSTMSRADFTTWLMGATSLVCLRWVAANMALSASSRASSGSARWV